MIAHGGVRWVPFEMFTHLNGTFDQKVQVLRKLGSETLVSKDVADAAACVVINEADAVVIT